MSNLLHLKGSRNQIRKSFPPNSFGSDGDIVFSSIPSKGVYLCSKINGRWFASNKLQELKKLENTSIKKLLTSKLSIKSTSLTPNKYNVSVGDFTLDVAGDIELNADGGQVTIKDNTTSHFKFDCDATKLTIYDDTNANHTFTIGITTNGETSLTTTNPLSTAHLTLSPSGNIILNTSGATDINKNNTKFGHFAVHHSGSHLRLLENGGASEDDYFDISCKANGETSITTVDAAAAAANLSPGDILSFQICLPSFVLPFLANISNTTPVQIDS